MLDIAIKTLPHAEQRYDTVGDYQESPDRIWVTDLADWRYEVLVAVHELVEMMICRHRKVSFDAIDAFDMSFDGPEPGDSKESPYFDEHQFASAVEKELAKELNVDWDAYEVACGLA